MAVARFGLAAHVNVCQPDNQQNKGPNPRQSNATRNKAADNETEAISGERDCKAQVHIDFME